MPSTRFKLSLCRFTTEGTSNLSYLLDEQHQQELRSFTPRMVEAVFGPGDVCDIPSKGYTDPEWYWKSSNGNVWGIGWRWGSPRLRGRGTTGNGGFWNHPDKLSAYEFVEFLKQQISTQGKS